MIKVEFTIDNEMKSQVFNNCLDDNFIKYLPSYLTKKHGVEITKEDLTIIDFTEQAKSIKDKQKENPRNWIEYGTTGKLKVQRRQPTLVPKDTYLTLEDFESAKAKREEAVQGASLVHVVSVPETIQHDFGEGDVDAVLIVEGHELAQPYSSDELEVTGTVVPWPYDEDGNYVKPNS